MTLADEIDALLTYPRQIASDARVLLIRAAAALRAYRPVKCPHGCDAGVEGKFDAGCIVRWRCLRCDSRWVP